MPRGSQQHNLSAKDFREPLLLALAEAVANTPKTPVHHEVMYEQVAQRAGVTLDQFGTQDDSGQPWVRRWIQWAFKAEKKTGRIESPMRGQWALTQEGLDYVQTLNQTTKPVAILTPTSPSNGSGLAPVIPVSLAVSGGYDETTYHPDPYLRVLAIEQTSCFGAFSPNSGTCETCKLQGACRNFLAATLSNLASELEAREQSGTTKPASSAATAADPASAAPATGTGKKGSGKWDNTGAQTIDAWQACVCYRCGDPIPQGQSCLWLRSTKDNPGGMFHHECE